MKKLIWLLLFLPALVAAQAPDEEHILREISTPTSPHYYPNLLLRYNTGDTTLTVKDYHYLYYGYAYRDEYKPLGTNDDQDRMLLTASAIDPEKPLISDLEALITAGFASLDRDPFSPKVLNLMAYAYGALGEKEREAAYYDRMTKVLATIEASGDGLSEKSPRHILMFDHALDLIRSEDHTPGKSRVISRTVEYVPLTVPAQVEDRKIKGYYFDYGRIYRNKPEGYTFKRDRTWQFNNLKPREYK